MTKLRKLRKDKGLGRMFVADKLNISPDHLSLLERGKSKMSLDKIEKLSELYNVGFEEMAIIANESRKGE